MRILRLSRIVGAGALLSTMLPVAASREAAPILGGTPAPEHRSVVYLWRKSMDCTGTLVGGRLFVTAAHCVPATAEQRVFVTNEALGERRVSSCVRHRAFADLVPYFDVAVCEIEGEVGAVPTSVLAAAVEVPGDVTYVGYGPTTVPEAGTPGAAGITPARTSGAGRVASVREGTLLVEGPGTIAGDSGGPVFVGTGPERGAIAGVLSCSSGMERRPRAVDLTNVANGTWVRRCLRDFAACRQGERRPSSRVPDTARPLCGD